EARVIRYHTTVAVNPQRQEKKVVIASDVEPGVQRTMLLHPFVNGTLEAMQHPSVQKDTTLTKIFVGGLPYHTTDRSLWKYFETFGDIDEAVVITDRQTGKSRGYGFVTMMEKAAAERACKDPNPIIDGRKANVNLAYLGAKPRSPQTGEQKTGRSLFT
ncbi:hypothetical protein NFI96_029526, partial [Prochilodus magdalenae]